MFLFTTTTLVNNGADAQVIKKTDGTVVGFRVKEGPAFKKALASCIELFKADYKAEAADTATVDLSGLTADINYRLNIYVRSLGNADPFYANDFVFKGKPFVIEFNDTTAPATQIKKLADKYMLALFDSKQLSFEASSDTSLKITGVNGFLRLFKIAVEKWVPSEVLTPDGAWETVFEMNKGTNVTSDKVVLTEGCEGIGTYELVLSDLRLPTGDNFAYLNVNAPQMPIVNGKYTQYTFRFTADLVNYPGGIGINNPVKSITNHVFFVESSAVTDFEKAVSDGLGLTATVVPAEEEGE